MPTFYYVKRSVTRRVLNKIAMRVLFTKLFDYLIILAAVLLWALFLLTVRRLLVFERFLSLESGETEDQMLLRPPLAKNNYALFN